MNELILIIEDNESIVKVLQRGLMYEGYKVESALDGEKGLKLAKQNRPDLVILDLMLPGIDGVEVCKQLRSDSNLPILMLTAKDAIQDRVLGLDAGADDYMVKPFELEEVLARVRALLRRTQSDRASVLTFADLTLDTSTRSGQSQRAYHSTHRHRVRSAGTLHAPSQPGAHPRADLRSHLGVRFRRREQRTGCLYPLFAPEA